MHNTWYAIIDSHSKLQRKAIVTSAEFVFISVGETNGEARVRGPMSGEARVRGPMHGSIVILSELGPYLTGGR